MSATFVLRKAWSGWTLNNEINVPSRTTAISDNEVYLYSVSTSNSETIGNYPVRIPVNTSTPEPSCETWLYLNMTKAPASKCNNFKFWCPSVMPATGVKMYVYSTAFASYHTSSTSIARCVTLATTYYSPGTGLTVPGQCTQVGSNTGYFLVQARVHSSAEIGTLSGSELTYHYGYDES